MYELVVVCALSIAGLLIWLRRSDLVAESGPLLPALALLAAPALADAGGLISSSAAAGVILLSCLGLTIWSLRLVQLPRD